MLPVQFHLEVKHDFAYSEVEWEKEQFQNEIVCFYPVFFIYPPCEYFGPWFHLF